MQADVLILAPKEEELIALLPMLNRARDWQEPSGRSYRIGRVRAANGWLRVAVTLSGKGITDTFPAVRESLDCLRPRLVILFGTAAGLRDTAIGDVLVGTEGRYYGQGKHVPGGVLHAPKSHNTSRQPLERARMAARPPADWVRHLATDNAVKPRVHFGPILSGDRVLADPDDPLLRYFAEYHYDAVGNEMEAYPFLREALRHPRQEAIIIRGVSDHFGDKAVANAAGSKELAVNNAAAFVREFLSREQARTFSSYYVVAGLVALVIVLSLASISWSGSGGEMTDLPSSATATSIAPAAAADTPTLVQKTVTAPPGEPPPPRVDPPKERIAEPSFAAPKTKETAPSAPVPALQISKDSARDNMTSTSSPPSEPEAKPAVPEPALFRYRFSIHEASGKRILPAALRFSGGVVPTEKDGTVFLPAGPDTLFYQHNGIIYDTPIYIHENIRLNGKKIQLR